MYSMHSSSVIRIFGAMREASSLPLARWLVNFFGFCCIYHKIAWLNMLGNDLACIHFFSRIYKETFRDPVSLSME